MRTRYTVQYWYIDEHDTLDLDLDTLQQAQNFASNIDKTKYKDIGIYARHWKRINEPFEYNGIEYDDWKWVLIDDDFTQYYDSNGKIQSAT